MSPPALDDPDLPLADMLVHWPELRAVFFRHNMLCVGCLIGPFHTLTDACEEYGLDEDRFLEELRAALNPADPPG